MTTKETERRRRPAERRRPLQEAPKPHRSTPEVVYLPPKPFNRNRLVLRLVTVAAVVVALVLGMSVFFKVENIEVAGCGKYTPWDISQASGIQVGDNLLSFGQAKAAGRITTALPYVWKARIGIKLPDTVTIYVEEIEVTYAIKSADDSWWLISSGGKVIEKAAEGAQEGYTKILGVQLADPQISAQAVAKETGSTQTDPMGGTVPVSVTQAKRLKTALDVVTFLEANGIIGKAASVDVNDMGDIQLWYGQQYQVKLGDDSQLSYKISCLKSTVQTLKDHDSGVLDISFTTRPDKVIYTPFNEN